MLTNLQLAKFLSTQVKWETFTLFFITCLFQIQTQAQNRSFEEKYGPLADSLGAVYGIPSSVILGVAIIESGSGKSRNARMLNNFFGIKGKNNLLKTKGIRSSYKQYPNDTASFVSFCGLVSRKKFYPQLKGNSDYRLWTDALSHAGYSEIPATWEKLINSTIRQHQLDKR
jgi:flagellum-specific peptidoglycan hydrolase FlgJ